MVFASAQDGDVGLGGLEHAAALPSALSSDLSVRQVGFTISCFDFSAVFFVSRFSVDVHLSRLALRILVSWFDLPCIAMHCHHPCV